MASWRIRMDWWFLIIAGVLEIGWAVGLKYTDGFTRLWPTVLTLVTLAASMVFLALAVRTIPIGTGYAVWTGIGAAGTAVLGIVLFQESAAGPRLVFIAIVLLGIVGLKMTSGH
jgi:quaternary ammonium compound-resistance protein SugE